MRITELMLQQRVNRLNKLTNSPLEYHTNGVINVGHFHLHHAYGGVCLHHTMNTSGGINTPLSQGHITKKELFAELCAFIAGIEYAQSL